MIKWDKRFLDLCKLIASWSKDPSTQTGAVIVRPDNTIVSTGYNGFPSKIKDTVERLENREMKYKLTIHCEINALISANESIKGCTLYTYPFISCERCAVQMIQAGIVRAVAPLPSKDKLERWKESFDLTRNLFNEANVELLEIDYD